MSKSCSPANRWIALSCLAAAAIVSTACDSGPHESSGYAAVERASQLPGTSAPPSAVEQLRTVDEYAPIGNPQDRPDPTLAPARVQADPASAIIRAARAELQPLNGSDVAGMIEFAQDGEIVNVIGKVTGLEPGKHGFHIHQNGDCSAPDGSSAGDHFAPHERPHGARDATATQRHVGDLGNITAAEDGTAEVALSDKVIRLDGTESVVDRAVIIHAQADDLTSQPSGNAGDRVACGVVREVIIEKTAPAAPIALRARTQPV